MIQLIKENKKILTAILISIIIIASLAIIFLTNYFNPYSEEISDDELSDAISDSINFLKNSNEPHTLLWLDVMFRRFGIGEFSNASKEYDQILENNPSQASQLRLFRRIMDYNNTLQVNDFNYIIVDLDKITLPALYCNRMNLPNDYSEKLEEAVNNGGYLLTHVLLASIWFEENGCQIPLSDNFLDRIYRDSAKLINNDSRVEDLELEAATFLYLARKGDLVPNSFIKKVITTQNIDGSWGEKDHTWHTTVLGSLLLLHIKYPSNLYPSTLSQPN